MAILAGVDCIERTTGGASRTIVLIDNPASGAGTVNQCELYPATGMTGIEYGAIEDTGGGGTGGSYTCRGNTNGSNLSATAGACRTHTGGGVDFTNFAIANAEHAGVWFVGGSLERSLEGFNNLVHNLTDQISTDNEATYTLLADDTGSLRFLDVAEGWTWGEQNPTPEAAVEWTEWKIKESAGDARDSGPWGKLQLALNDEFVSDVKDLGSAVSRLFTLTYDDYASGTGSGTLYWRGKTTGFNQDDDEVSGPTWEEYTGPANKSWRYVQVMAEG